MKDLLITEGPYKDNDESLKNYETPSWFRNAKLGIFIHWGIYSVPARVNEWYPREMYGRFKDLFSPFPPNPLVWVLHKLRFGGRKKTGYKDFIPHFKGEKFNPEYWADSFKKWGARYVVPVGEHHDGFPMYKTDFTQWNAAEMGPERDVIRELRKEVKSRDMHFGISTHRAWNWSYYRFYKGDDTMEAENFGLYGIPHKTSDPESDDFLEDWQGRVKEMIDEFEPEVLYFDFGWHRPRFDSLRKKMAAYYYNEAEKKGYGPVLNYKHQGGASGSAGFNEGSAVLDIERGSSPGIRQHPWQTCTSISYKSWGYIDNDNFRTSEALIRDLIDIVSKNGNLLINIGPRPDGSFPEEAVIPLEKLGEWLEQNGEAIYDTRPWRSYGEGPVHLTKKGTRGFSEKDLKYGNRDFRFTMHGKTVYAIQMNPKDSTDILLSTFTPEDKILKITTIDNNAIKWEQLSAGLKMEAPAASASLPRVFRIELE